MLQVHLSDQQFYCLPRCVLCWRCDGTQVFSPKQFSMLSVNSNHTSRYSWNNRLWFLLPISCQLINQTPKKSNYELNNATFYITDENNGVLNNILGLLPLIKCETDQHVEAEQNGGNFADDICKLVYLYYRQISHMGRTKSQNLNFSRFVL